MFVSEFKLVKRITQLCNQITDRKVNKLNQQIVDLKSQLKGLEKKVDLLAQYHNLELVSTKTVGYQKVVKKK